MKLLITAAVIAAASAPAHATSLFDHVGIADATLARTALDLSASLRALTTTGAVIQTPAIGFLPATTVLTGANLSGRTAFDLTADQFANLGSLSVLNLGAGAVINVGGKSVSANAGLCAAATTALTTDPSRVIFNFYEANTVTLRNASLCGGVLAPDAVVSPTNATALGAIVAKGLTGGAATQGFLNVGVAGTPAAAAVPEPATWATLVLGLGAIGYAMRRRRVRVAAA